MCIRDRKTICVGNIYLGGTGKTPLTNLIASKLKKKFKTAIIKKGYSDHIDEKKLLEKKLLNLRLLHKKQFLRFIKELKNMLRKYLKKVEKI